MIILRYKEDQIKKLQSGGRADLLVGVAEGYVPMKLTTPGFASTIRPMTPQGNPNRGSGYGRGSNKTAGDTTKSEGGFDSDALHISEQINAINSTMASKVNARGKEYTDSGEFKTDYAEFIRLNEDRARLEEKKKNFMELLKGKDIENGAYAIYNDRVFVEDVSSPDKEWEIIDLVDALQNQDQYKILTIGNARSARASKKEFNGYEASGQELEEMIYNVPSKGDLDKTLQTAFKTANVMSRDGETLVMGDGTAVNVLDFIDYLSAGNNAEVTAEIFNRNASNEKTLTSAMDYLLKSVAADPTLQSAYRSRAIGSLMSKGYSTKGKTPEELAQDINNEIVTDLKAKMQYYIKTDFADTYKAASDAKAAAKAKANEKPDLSKINIRMPTIYINQAQPERMLNYEYGALLPMKSVLQEVTGAPIIEDAFINEGWNDKTLAHNIENASNLKTMIDGTPATAIKLGDGKTPIQDASDGKGYEMAMIPSSEKVMILQDVPSRRINGVWTIDQEYVKLKSEFKKRLLEKIDLIETQQKGKMSEESKRLLADEIAKDLQAKNERYRKMYEEIRSGTIRPVDYASWRTVLPKTKNWATWFDPGQAAIEEYFIDVSQSDINEYEKYMVERGIDDNSSEELTSLIVFAPLHAYADRVAVNYKGIETREMKASELDGNMKQKQAYLTGEALLEDITNNIWK